MLLFGPISLLGMVLTGPFAPPIGGAVPAPSTGISATQTNNPAIDAIDRADNPSAAVEAYARAISTNPGSPTIESAYLNRMVDLGVPAMAEQQASDLILRDPDNGRAWAVAAYVNGRKGSTDAALAQIETAAKRAPNDEFVQHTAGQLLADYDAHPDATPQPPDAVIRDLPQLRDSMAGKETFENSYRDARESYRREEQNPSTSSTASATEPAPAPASARVYDDSIIANESLTAPSYTPVYYEPYYRPAYYGYYGYYGPRWSYWCWPSTSLVVIHDHDGHHGHHDGGHHDGDRHDGRDGDRDGRRWRDRDLDRSATLVPNRSSRGATTGNRGGGGGRQDASAGANSNRVAPFVPSRPNNSSNSGATAGNSARRPQAQPSAPGPQRPQARPAPGAQRPQGAAASRGGNNSGKSGSASSGRSGGSSSGGKGGGGKGGKSGK